MRITLCRRDKNKQCSGIYLNLYRTPMVCRVWGSNSGGGEIFRTGPDRPWDPSSLLHKGYRVFPRAKAAGRWRWPPTPFSAEVKETVELYIYSPSGPSWPVLGWPLPLTLPLQSVTDIELDAWQGNWSLCSLRNSLAVGNIRCLWQKRKCPAVWRRWISKPVNRLQRQYS
jgi:hypothetical protein